MLYKCVSLPSLLSGFSYLPHALLTVAFIVCCCQEIWVNGFCLLYVDCILIPDLVTQVIFDFICKYFDEKIFLSG